MNENSTRPVINDIILMWKAAWGNKFPKNHENRIQEFSNIFETLKLHGYDKEEIKFSLKKIHEATINFNEFKTDKKMQERIRAWNWETINQVYISYFEPIEIKEGKPIDYKNYREIEKKENPIENLPVIQSEDVPFLESLPDMDRSQLPDWGQVDTTVSEEEFWQQLESEKDE